MAALRDLFEFGEAASFAEAEPGADTPSDPSADPALDAAPEADGDPPRRAGARGAR
jgi:hypothetical protein